MKLGDKQYLAIKYILEGRQIASIAKEIGISRATIYNWLDDEEFKNELDMLRQEIQSSTKEHVMNKIKLYVDELEELALNKDTSSKVRADLLKYLVNRVWGNTTTKAEVTVTEEENDNDMLDIEKFKKELKKDAGNN